MKWFGESWGARVCEVTENHATPIGTLCAHGCGHSIRYGDQGLMIPIAYHWPSEMNDMIVYDKNAEPYVAYHLVCFFDDIGIRGRTHI